MLARSLLGLCSVQFVALAFLNAGFLVLIIGSLFLRQTQLKLQVPESLLVAEPAVGHVMSHFQQRMTEAEKDMALELLRSFHKTVSANGIVHYMYGGTLIGSFRHHGFVPWDDDMDVMVPHSQQQRVLEILINANPRYRYVVTTDRYPWKFYFNQTAYNCTDCRNMWPFVDIFFYGENSTHVWDVGASYIRDYVYKKVDVFPLKIRPFGSLLLPAPKKTHTFLTRTYNVDLCTSNSRDHRRKEAMKVHYISCAALTDRLPFVQRKRHGNGCLEELVQAGQVLGSYVIENLNC